MKKMKLLIAAAAVLVASAGLVQLAPAEEAQVKGPNRGNMASGCAVGKPMNADSHLAKMATCLGLSEDQKAKIKPLLEENFKAKQAVRADQNLTREQRRAKMLELRGQLHDKIKPLLTPEQNSQVAEHGNSNRSRLEREKWLQETYGLREGQPDGSGQAPGENDCLHGSLRRSAGEDQADP